MYDRIKMNVTMIRYEVGEHQPETRRDAARMRERESKEKLMICLDLIL
jgi:hypothetical protein